MLQNPGVPDPLTGQPIPTVQVRLLDNHQVEFGECQRWASSDAGQDAAQQNPQGYATVEAHAQAHQLAMIQMQMQQAAPKIAAAAGKESGGSEEGAPDQDQPVL